MIPLARTKPIEQKKNKKLTRTTLVRLCVCVRMCLILCVCVLLSSLPDIVPTFYFVSFFSRLAATDGKVLKIIHNYGHGGAGVTLAFGCARDVLALVEREICAVGGTTSNNNNSNDNNNDSHSSDVARRTGNVKLCADEHGKVNFKSKL